jgi:hypothetical protein
MNLLGLSISALIGRFAFVGCSAVVFPNLLLA